MKPTASTIKKIKRLVVFIGEHLEREYAPYPIRGAPVVHDYEGLLDIVHEEFGVSAELLDEWLVEGQKK